jgi:CrcB protein
LQKYLLIAIGGAFGSMARYWVGDTIAGRMEMRFPMGTFVVNMSACVLMGFALGMINHRPEWNQGWRFLVPVGFIGAYSTFSTYEWEIFLRLENGIDTTALFYAGVSLVLGLAGVWCGVQAAKIFV